MNLDIEQIFAEIGRLHCQVTLLQTELAKAQSQLSANTETVQPVKE